MPNEEKNSNGVHMRERRHNRDNNFGEMRECERDSSEEKISGYEPLAVLNAQSRHQSRKGATLPGLPPPPVPKRPAFPTFPYDNPKSEETESSDPGNSSLTESSNSLYAESTGADANWPTMNVFSGMEIPSSASKRQSCHHPRSRSNDKRSFSGRVPSTSNIQNQCIHATEPTTVPPVLSSSSDCRHRRSRSKQKKQKANSRAEEFCQNGQKPQYRQEQQQAVEQPYYPCHRRSFSNSSSGTSSASNDTLPAPSVSTSSRLDSRANATSPVVAVQSSRHRPELSSLRPNFQQPFVPRSSVDLFSSNELNKPAESLERSEKSELTQSFSPVLPRVDTSRLQAPERDEQYDELFIGVLKESRVCKYLRPNEFCLYYKAPRRRNDLPVQLPLMLGYMSSQKQVFNFPVLCTMNSTSGEKSWQVKYGDPRPVTFPTLSSLVKYHKIYSYMDPVRGKIDTFPVWRRGINLYASSNSEALLK